MMKWRWKVALVLMVGHAVWTMGSDDDRDADRCELDRASHAPASPGPAALAPTLPPGLHVWATRDGLAFEGLPAITEDGKAFVTLGYDDAGEHWQLERIDAHGSTTQETTLLEVSLDPAEAPAAVAKLTAVLRALHAQRGLSPMDALAGTGEWSGHDDGRIAVELDDGDRRLRIEIAGRVVLLAVPPWQVAPTPAQRACAGDEVAIGDVAVSRPHRLALLRTYVDGPDCDAPSPSYVVRWAEDATWSDVAFDPSPGSSVQYLPVRSMLPALSRDGQVAVWWRAHGNHSTGPTTAELLILERGAQRTLLTVDLRDPAQRDELLPLAGLMIDQIARTVDLQPLRRTEELRDLATGELRCVDYPCTAYVSDRQGLALRGSEAGPSNVARLVPR